jgi:transglutaminase-like putative cysteine protease
MKQRSKPAYQPGPTERFFDLFSAVLLMFAMIAAALRLSATDWAEHLEVTQSTVFWGILLGLAVGKSIYSARAALLFFINYGLIIIPWQLGLLLFSPKVEWKERLLSMAGRIGQVFNQIAQREQVTDNMLFLLLMTILFWAITTFAAYILVRKAGVWRAVVPMGITALVIETFDPILARRGWFLAIYLFLALLLVARTHYLMNSRRWREDQTHVPSDASYEQTRFAVGIVLVLVLVSWNIPALAGDVPVFSSIYQEHIEPFRQKLSDRMSFMFSSLRESVGLVYDYYGDQMTLGSGSIHTDEVELTVEAPGFVYVGQRFYWRARVYDRYEAGGWQTSFTEDQDYLANQSLPIPDSATRLQAVFKIRPRKSILTVYAAGQPLMFSRSGSMQSITNPDGSLDFAAMKADPYLRAGEVYEVTASLPSMTEMDLRSAGVEYPDWVRERYLQLPAEITPRTIALARQIAANYDTPYDIAKAVTNYLRQNIEYVETLDQLPGRQEAVDWFLFDHKKGFCNYYATAEVMLLRALGIPARMAVGYAEGEGVQAEGDPAQVREGRFDGGTEPDLVVYTVRQRDAHAWPEVFFPGYGWVEFEPTSSLEPIFRASGERIPLEPLDEAVPDLLPDNLPQEDDGLPEEEQPASEEEGWQLTPIQIGLGLIAVGAIVGLLALLVQARQRRLPALDGLAGKLRFKFPPLSVSLERGMRRVGMRPPDFIVARARYQLLPALSKAYVEIDRALTRLGNEPSPSQTPAERAAQLVQLLPAVSQPVGRLVSEYQLTTYSPHQGDSQAAQQASTQIRRQSIIAYFQKRLDQLTRPIKRRFNIRGVDGW